GNQVQHVESGDVQISADTNFGVCFGKKCIDADIHNVNTGSQQPLRACFVEGLSISGECDHYSRMANGILEHFKYELVRQWFSVAGITNVSGTPLPVLPDFIDKLCVEFGLQRTPTIMLGFLELWMRAMRAGEIAELGRIDQKLRRELRFQPVVESILRGELGVHIRQSIAR